MPSDPAPPVCPSGVVPVDATWGGFLRGGTYLLVGPIAGRGPLALAALRGCAEAGGRALLVSSRPPAALLAAAAETGFDLAGAYRQGRAKLLAAPPPATLAPLDDAGLTRALDDLAALARQHRADRLVVEDFSAFVRFSSFEAFAVAFHGLADAAASAGATLVLGLGEPANEPSRRLLLFLQSETAGTLHVAPAATGGPAETRLTLLPGAAHAGVAHTAPWPPGAPPVAFEETPLADVPPEAAALPPEAAALPPVPEPEAAEPPEPGAPDADPFATAPLGAHPSEDRAPASDPLGEDPFGDDDGVPGGYAGSDGFADPAGLALDPPDLFVTAPPPVADAGWTAVTPVDPAEAPFAGPAARDPFGVDLGPDLLALGHFVDSRTHGAAPPTGNGVADGLDEAASSVHAAAYPSLFTPEPPAEGPEEPAAPAEDPEAAFRRALDAAFARRAETPFLVLALRLDPAGPHADLLPAVAHGLDQALGSDGALFGNPATGRLVALLPGAGSEAAAGLFAAVRAHLHAVAPGRAAEALRAVGALTVPSGEPFATADDLLAYVLA